MPARGSDARLRVRDVRPDDRGAVPDDRPGKAEPFVAGRTEGEHIVSRRSSSKTAPPGTVRPCQLPAIVNVMWSEYSPGSMKPNSPIFTTMR